LLVAAEDVFAAGAGVDIELASQALLARDRTAVLVASSPGRSAVQISDLIGETSTIQIGGNNLFFKVDTELNRVGAPILLGGELKAMVRRWAAWFHWGSRTAVRRHSTQYRG